MSTCLSSLAYVAAMNYFNKICCSDKGVVHIVCVRVYMCVCVCVIAVITTEFFTNLPYDYRPLRFYFSWRNSPVRLIIQVSGSHTIRHTRPVELPWTSNQHIAKAATYTAHSKPKRQISMPSAVLKLRPPAFARLQTNAWDRTATGVDIYIF